MRKYIRQCLPIPRAAQALLGHTITDRAYLIVPRGEIVELAGRDG